MAILTDNDRVRVWRALMRYWSARFDQFPGCLKGDIRSAVNVADQWIEDNQAAFNATLPLPFRTAATAAEKTVLFCAVAAMRENPEFVRRIIAEID